MGNDLSSVLIPETFSAMTEPNVAAAAAAAAVVLSAGYVAHNYYNNNEKKNSRFRKKSTRMYQPPPPGAYGGDCCGGGGGGHNHGCGGGHHHQHVHPDLQQHSKVFQKQILKVDTTTSNSNSNITVSDPSSSSSSNVYVAIGYGLANTILIDDDPDGVIVIDTTESPDAARELLHDFRQLVQHTKPIIGIIYTHFHHDHVAGSVAFVDEELPTFNDDDNHDKRQSPTTARPKIQIWAHHSTEERITQFNSVMGPIAYSRAAKMYGTLLDKPDHENCGIGPFLRHGLDPDDVPLAVCPTHTYNTQQQTIAIGSTQLTLIHAPGETDDQTVVLYEATETTKILLAADNFYESFPNLYTIRGAPSRDVLQWARSLDRMASQGATIMIPAHTLPVYGSNEICTRLTNYRDAIRYVHDQTLQGILRGYHPDEIASSVQLPDHLSSLEYCKEYYGTVEWSSKAIFQHYLGWFSGSVEELHPLPPYKKACRLVTLGGGIDTVLDQAEETIHNNDGEDDGEVAEEHQWALELSSAVVRLYDEYHKNRDQQRSDKYVIPSRSQIQRARVIKATCCRYLAERSISANGRNWYMTESLKCEHPKLDGLQLPPAQRKHAILTMPWSQILNSMTLRLKSNPSLERVEKRMCFIIHPDNEDDDEFKENVSGISTPKKEQAEERWTLHMRNCVLNAVPSIPTDESQIDILIECTNTSLRQMIANPSSLSSITSMTSGLFGGRNGDSGSSSFSKNPSAFVVKKGDVASAFAFLRNLDRSL